MCINYVTISLFLIILSLAFINSEKLIVETTHGSVEGKSFKTFLNKVPYNGFLGIPYAAPPVGDLKFLPPQPLVPWDGVLLGKKHKKACLQYNNNVLKGQPLGWYGKEDCLYLDIYTPNTDTTLRPVIVFLYNTNFQNSYNKTKDYSPDFFIEEDIVIVTLEHRLSVLGFLSLEDEVVSGNSGLKDIVAGLEWTKNNIERFGGDPNRITLMGSQGGAAAVDLLLHSTAKHLFSAAILQGGTSFQSMYLHEHVRDRAYKLAEVLKRASSSNSKLLKELNDLPTSDLLQKEMRAAPPDYFKENQRGVLSFSPIVEKQPDGLITEYPEDSQDRIDIPVMVGYNSLSGLEASILYLEEPRYLSFVQKDFPFYMPIRVKFKFDPTKEICYKAVDEVKTFYYKKGRVTVNSLTEHIKYLGDILTVYPIDYTAKSYLKRTSNSLYYYYFDYQGDLNENKNNIMKFSTVDDGAWGAAAGDELCYLFYCPDLKETYMKHNDASEEMILLKKMVKMWTNFAKYGNPTPEEDSDLDGLKWSKYDLNDKKYLHIGKQIELKSNLHEETIEFWDNFITKWRQIAVDGLVTEETMTRDEL